MSQNNEADIQRKFAVDLFNGVWDLLDQADRTPDEDERMVHMAHASRYHWERVGEPVNLVRGDWQIARVYAVVGRAEPAQYHAQRCLERCRQHEISDFDLAFAYEALARAAAVAADTAARDEYLRQARAAGEQIAEEDDKEYFFRELATIA